MAKLISSHLIGALTSKPYSFKARSWELKGYNSIDLQDSLGSNIKVEVRGNKIFRVLPRLNEFLNEDWISDKARFSFDGLKVQRLDYPLLGFSVFNEGQWQKNFKKVNFYLVFCYTRLLFTLAKVFNSWSKGRVNKQLVGIGDTFNSLEEGLAFKNFLNQMGTPHIYTQNNITNLNCKVDLTFQDSYLFETSLASFDHVDSILLISSDTRFENPILNLVLRRKSLEGSKIYLIGSGANLNFSYEHIGSSTNSAIEFLEGRNPWCSKFINAKSAAIIIGETVRLREDSSIFNRLLLNFRALNPQIFINFLNLNCNTSGFSDIGFSPAFNSNQLTLKRGSSNVIPFEFHLNTYNIISHGLGVFENWRDFAYKTTKIFQGTHGSSFLRHFDIVYPKLVAEEIGGSFVNNFGTVQQVPQIINGPGMARSGILILDALRVFLNINLKGHFYIWGPYTMRNRWINPNFFSLDLRSLQDLLITNSYKNDILKYSNGFSSHQKLSHLIGVKSIFGRLNSSIFNNLISNYYSTNFISGNSTVMTESSYLLLNSVNQNYIK